jgi:thiamine-phosphate pyrophosphorylase
MSEAGGGSGLPLPCLSLVTDRSRCRGRRLEEIVSEAIDGGANLVQLREKELPGGELYDLALALRDVVHGRGLLFVNERLDVAQACGADGVHLPERGLPIRIVRELVGESLLVGRSVHSVEAAVRAQREGADFVQVGTVFATRSKPDVQPAGLELVSAVRATVSIPVLAIGGIDATNVSKVMRAGADGVAVISAIMDAEDPRAAARKLREAVSEAWVGPPAGARR